MADSFPVTHKRCDYRIFVIGAGFTSGPIANSDQQAYPARMSTLKSLLSRLWLLPLTKEQSTTGY